MMENSSLMTIYAEGKCCLLSTCPRLKSTYQFLSALEFSDLESVNSGNIDLQSSLKIWSKSLNVFALDSNSNVFLWQHLCMIPQYTRDFLQKCMNMNTGNGSDMLTEPL